MSETDKNGGMLEEAPGPSANAEDIRFAVERRVQEEQAARPEAGKDADESPDPKFITECLEGNELGDAELWKRLVKDDYKFNISSKKWMRWAGHHWASASDEEVLATVELCAKAYESLIPGIWNQAREIPEDDSAKKKLFKKKDKIEKRSDSLRTVRRRKNILEMAASSFNPAAVNSEDIDQKPHLLACPNGVIDLRSGELLPGKKEDFLVSACPTEYRGIDEPRPRWDRFVLEIMGGSRELAEFMKVLMGVAIWGAVVEHIFVILYGPGGRNGKGTFVETCAKILGKFLAAPILPEMLLDVYRVNPSAPSPERLSLRGKRLVWASEPEDGRKIASGKVKGLTGNDTVVARGHYQEEVSFLPSHTLFFLANFLMRADSNDPALWERVINIPFNIRFVKKPESKNEMPVDTRLAEAFEAEASGILGWIVEGCLVWQEFGLNLPPQVIHATAEYRKEEDDFNGFIGFLCLIREDYEVGATELYDAFTFWWRRYISSYPPKQKKFGTFLKTKFFSDTPNGRVVYYGLKLRDNWQDIIGFTAK